MAAPDFDVKAAHKHFSLHCFNKTWDFLDKADRSPADTDEMIRLSLAALWHWSQREDCTPRNLSVGYWQASRVHALAGEAKMAVRYGLLALEHARNEPPFYQAYAHEALARAAKVAGNRQGMDEHLAKARELAATIADPEEKKMIMPDLESFSTQ